jgi:ferredoxin/flavodoxin
MKSEIYYFSGTGNSLFVAKQLAKELDARVVPIASVVGKNIAVIDSDVLGIVFPVYFATFGESGIPFIVQRFIQKPMNLNGKYIFVVCTHGGVHGSAVHSFAELLKRNRGTLSAGFAIRMSISYSAFDKLRHAIFHRELPVQIHSDERKLTIFYEKCKDEVREIAQTVRNQRTVKLERHGKFLNLFTSILISPLRRMALSRYRRLSGMKNDKFEYLTKNADRALLVGDKCNGCGVCIRVCPVGNIILKSNRPEWQHRCESCYACYTWCPSAAIQGDLVEYERRYHHPEINVSDMFWRDRQGTSNGVL